MNKFSLAAVPVAFIVGMLALSPQAKATGGDDECDDVSCTSFFAPEVIERPLEAPFFRSGHTFYGGDMSASSETIESVSAVNLREWMNRFGNKLTKESSTYLIYKVSVDELDRIVLVLGGKSATLAPESTKLVLELKTFGNPSFITSTMAYLRYSKTCEPLTIRNIGEGSWDAPKGATTGDISQAAQLIKDGQQKISLEKDEFLKERYKLQVIRLMYYSGRYDDAEKFYGSDVATFKLAGSPEHRFIDAAAGSFYKEKKYGIANYLFSLSFDTFAPLKRLSWLSFHPQEQADWNQSLELAKTLRQKEVLWQMFGITADGLEAINKIYAMDPKSDLLQLLLVREVNKAEEDLVANDDVNVQAVDATTSGSNNGKIVVGQKRLQLIKSIADAGNASKPYLWDLAAAHMYALVGDTSSSANYLRMAIKNGMPKDDILVKQARMTKLLSVVQRMKSVDKSAENYLGIEIVWLKAQTDQRGTNLQTWVFTKLSGIYKKGGQPIAALMLKDDPASSLYQQNQTVESIKALINNPSKTNFEKGLVAAYPYKLSDLLQIEAVNLLYAGKFEQASQAFASLHLDDADKMLQADPFLIHIDDCHDCDIDAPHAKMTKAEFAAKLAQLQVAAKGTGPQAAQASLMFANGLYNMSYYGNNRVVFSTPYSNFDGSKKVNSNKAAMGYYDRAMTLSTDKELSAQACFMAAKTEQNEFYNKKGTKQMEYADGSPHSPKYFGILKSKFSDTQYYQEVIKECGEFRRSLK